MRLHGYCYRCHKVKLVTIMRPSKGVQIGLCRDCEEAKK